MESKLIGLSIFFCIIQSSFALKCFECNTASFTKCSDLSGTDLQPRDCSVETYNQNGKLSDQLGFGDELSSAKAPTCLKVTSKNSKTGAKAVDRLCTFKSQAEACAMIPAKFQKTSDDVIEFCGTCNDKDGCNNGSQIKLFYSLIVLGAIVSSARLFV